MNTIKIPLHEIAHGRTGDKGNRLNISVIAYSREFWPIILQQVTEEQVLALFKHRGASRVVRYVVDNLMALNFVIDDVLEGGVNSSLNIDMHGKTNSFRLLGLMIDAPEEIETHITKLRSTKS